MFLEFRKIWAQLARFQGSDSQNFLCKFLRFFATSDAFTTQLFMENWKFMIITVVNIIFNAICFKNCF